jgi:hypothetical protein
MLVGEQLHQLGHPLGGLFHLTNIHRYEYMQLKR